MQTQKLVGKNMPAMKFKAGAISATIWANKGTSKKGEEVAFQTVSLDRRYKDKEGNWQSSGSLRSSDIPKAMLVLQEAYKAITLNQNPSSEKDEEMVY